MMTTIRLLERVIRPATALQQLIAVANKELMKRGSNRAYSRATAILHNIARPVPQSTPYFRAFVLVFYPPNLASSLNSAADT